MTNHTDAETDPRSKNQPFFKTNVTPDEPRSAYAGEPDTIKTLVTNLEEETNEMVDFGRGDGAGFSPQPINEIKTWLFDGLDARISSTEHALRELVESVRIDSENGLVIDWENSEQNATANTRLNDVFQGITDKVIKLIRNEIGWFLPPTDFDRYGYSFSKQFALLNYGVQPPLSQERIGRLLHGASQSVISRLSGPVNRLLEINSILYGELERNESISIADPLEESIQRYRNSYRGEQGGGGARVDRTITPVALIKDGKTGLIFSVSFICVSNRDVIGDSVKRTEEVQKKVESALPSPELASVAPFTENNALDEALENANYQIDQHIVCFILRRGSARDTWVDEPVYVASEALGEEFDSYGDPGDYIREMFEKKESKPEVMSLREIFDNYDAQVKGRSSNGVDKNGKQSQE